MSITAPGVTGTLLTVTVPIAPNGNIVFTGQDSFSQQVSVTVTTGTAPFSIASTTVVPNLNAQLHNGLTAPASAIVGISDTQTLSNKTLTSPTSTGADSGAETLTNKTVDISANTLKTATNTAGHVPRNNGTQYVDGTLACGDLSNATAACSTALQGTDTSLLTSGTVSASAGVALCTDANHGATTSGCASGGVTEATMLLGSTSSTGNTLSGGGCGTNGAVCNIYIFPNAHTLVRVVIVMNIAASGCSTSAVVGVRDITGATNLSATTVGGSTGVIDSGAISVSMTAAHQIGIGLITAASGCTTFPSMTSLTAIYQ